MAKYRVVCYMRVDVEPEIEELFDSIVDAEEEVDNISDMFPDNIYEIEEVEDDE